MPIPFLSTLRWWQQLLIAFVIVILLLVLTAFLIRWGGYSSARQEIAVLRATGYLPTDQELLSSLPDRPREAQQNLRRLVQKLRQLEPRLNLADFATSNQASLAWITSDGVMPQELRTKVADGRARFSEIRATLRIADVVVGTADYLEERLASGRTVDFKQDYRVVIGALAQYLRLAALAGEAEALDDLDAIRLATRHPVAVSDVTHSEAYFCDSRDQTYLDLALLGRLDPLRAQAWLSEPFWDAKEMARCMRFDLGEWIHHGERAGLNDGSFVFAPQHPFSELSQVPVLACDWLFIGSDVAAYVRFRKAIADNMESPGASLSASPETFRTQHGAVAGISFARYILGWLTEYAVRHRLTRLATRLILHYQRTGSVPDSAAAMQAICGDNALAADGLCPGLVYIRTDSQSFRLAVDASLPPAPSVPRPQVWFTQALDFLPPLSRPFSHPARTIAIDHLTVRIPEQKP